MPVVIEFRIITIHAAAVAFLIYVKFRFISKRIVPGIIVKVELKLMTVISAVMDGVPVVPCDSLRDTVPSIFSFAISTMCEVEERRNHCYYHRCRSFVILLNSKQRSGKRFLAVEIIEFSIRAVVHYKFGFQDYSEYYVTRRSWIMGHARRHPLWITVNEAVIRPKIRLPVRVSIAVCVFQMQ